MTSGRKNGKPAGPEAGGDVAARDAKARATEQNRVLNRHRRQLHRLAGHVTNLLNDPRTDEKGRPLPWSPSEVQSMTRTLDQLHQMERRAHGIDSGQAEAPSVILVPVLADGSMGTWQAQADAAGLTGTRKSQQAGRSRRAPEPDLEGEADDWGDDQAAGAGMPS